MEQTVKVSIDATREQIWHIITDIGNSADVISGISKVETLEKPENGLVGLKWRETRTMFGKEATEVMWITDAVENESYRTRAESHGAIYRTEMKVLQSDNASILSMTFNGTPRTLVARFMWALMGFMFRNSTKKARQQDLNDIKKAAERLPD